MVDPLNKTTAVSATGRSGATPVSPVAASPQAAATRASAKPAPTIGDMVEAGPPVDAAKVATLKAEIAAGRYTIDADRLANDIIDQGKGSAA